MPTAAVMAGGAILGAVSSRNASKRAAKSQTQGQDQALAATKAAAAQATATAIPLFESAQQNALAGFQGALNTFEQVVPQQAQFSQSGNVAAQQQLLAGLPQFQNAILGNQVDFSQLQPTQLDTPDFSFLSQGLPGSTSVTESLAGPAPIQGPQQFGGFGGEFGGFGGFGNNRSGGGGLGSIINPNFFNDRLSQR